MSATAPIRTDHEIQQSVQDELEWTPQVDAAGIGVAVEDGVVSLSGEVDTYGEKLAAKSAAQRVRGVTTVVDNTVVAPHARSPITENDLAKLVDHALKTSNGVPRTVKAEVVDRRVILTGEVEWEFERRAARKAIEALKDVDHVESRITLAARPSADDTGERIRNALTRNALLDANAIHVDIAGTTATLTGTVSSLAHKLQAGTTAWSSPHVTEVKNNLIVRPL